MDGYRVVSEIGSEQTSRELPTLFAIEDSKLLLKCVRKNQLDVIWTCTSANNSGFCVYDYQVDDDQPCEEFTVWKASQTIVKNRHSQSTEQSTPIGTLENVTSLAEPAESLPSEIVSPNQVNPSHATNEKSNPSENSSVEDDDAHLNWLQDVIWNTNNPYFIPNRAADETSTSESKEEISFTSIQSTDEQPSLGESSKFDPMQGRTASRFNPMPGGTASTVDPRQRTTNSARFPKQDETALKKSSNREGTTKHNTAQNRKIEDPLDRSVSEVPKVPRRSREKPADKSQNDRNSTTETGMLEVNVESNREPMFSDVLEQLCWTQPSERSETVQETQPKEAISTSEVSRNRENHNKESTLSLIREQSRPQKTDLPSTSTGFTEQDYLEGIHLAEETDEIQKEDDSDSDEVESVLESFTNQERSLSKRDRETTEVDRFDVTCFGFLPLKATSEVESSITMSFKHVLNEKLLEISRTIRLLLFDDLVGERFVERFTNLFVKDIHDVVMKKGILSKTAL